METLWQVHGQAESTSPVWSEIDLNRDGKMDLFMYDRSDNRIITLINNGASGPQALRYTDSSSYYAAMFPKLSGWAFLYDYNNDGLPDLFTTNAFNSGILQFKASYNQPDWTFTAVDSSIQAWYGPVQTNIVASADLTPNLNDVDGDGDMDILKCVTCVGSFAYFRNYSMEHYGVPDTLNDYVWKTNSWGGFALQTGNLCYAKVCCYNVSCRLIPDPHPIKWEPEESARKDDTFAFIYTIDLDGDGDKDALLGDGSAINVLALYNGGTKDTAKIVSEDDSFPVYNAPAILPSFTNFGYADVDNDGLKDLLVGNQETGARPYPSSSAAHPEAVCTADHFTPPIPKCISCTRPA